MVTLNRTPYTSNSRRLPYAIREMNSCFCAANGYKTCQVIVIDYPEIIFLAPHILLQFP
jgi:hypothetical protein